MQRQDRMGSAHEAVKAAAHEAVEAAAPAGRTGAVVGVAELISAPSPVVRGCVKSRCVASVDHRSMGIAG